MKQIIRVTEANNKKFVTLIPICNIEYIQCSMKEGSKDTHIKLKGTSRDDCKFFFVSETVEEIEAQINAS